MTTFQYKLRGSPDEVRKFPRGRLEIPRRRGPRGTVWARVDRRRSSARLHLRGGVHTSQVGFVAGDVRGIAVHAAARVMSLAAPDELLVSSTTVELAAGAGVTFDDRGSHELKGLTGPRQLLAASLLEG